MSIPGVFGVGSTRQAAINDFRDALRALLNYLAEIGEPAPRARAFSLDVVEV